MADDRASPRNSDFVLICDDESRLAALTAGLLEDYGYRLHTARSGEEATTFLREQSVRVLLLDVNLAEGLTAMDVLEALEHAGSDTGVILTSGLAAEDVPSALMSHPRVSTYLPKPYSLEALVDAVRRAAGHAA